MFRKPRIRLRTGVTVSKSLALQLAFLTDAYEDGRTTMIQAVFELAQVCCGFKDMNEMSEDSRLVLLGSGEAKSISDMDRAFIQRYPLMKPDGTIDPEVACILVACYKPKADGSGFHMVMPFDPKGLL
ncbi:MAG TPA: hypothetical protein VEB18_03150 [Candidatus Paceibacterota bacterium]|nr:hypothetical protein [Candidatus Paceibacterota bacterium]